MFERSQPHLTAHMGESVLASDHYKDKDLVTSWYTHDNVDPTLVHDLLGSVY